MINNKLVHCKNRICFCATLELSVRVFLTDHMRLLHGLYDINVIVNTDNSRFLDQYGLKVRIIPVDIARDLSPLRDLRSLFYIYTIFRNEKYGIVHSIMPKSGLLAMMAGFFARVPVRIHTFTGQLWKNYRGLKRFFLNAWTG